MIAEAAKGMFSNAALLLTVGMVYFLIPLDPTARTLRRKIAVGLFLGLIGIGVMTTHWELTPGLIFDTRSVLLVVAGLFFGPLPTAVAVLVDGGYRLFVGGVGTIMGLGVILSSAGIGLLWRHYFPNRSGWGSYYLVGILVHLVMLAWMFALPLPLALKTLQGVALPVLLIYPLATMVLGKLLDLQRYWFIVRENALFNERRLRGMLEHAWGIIYLLDENGQCRYVSESVKRILGHTPEELIDAPLDHLVHPEDAEEVQGLFRDILAHPGMTREHVYRVRNSDGHWIWMENVITNLLKDPDVSAVVLHSRDITERIQAEAALRFARSRAQIYFDTVEAIIIALDREGRIVAPNRKACEILGYSEEELIGEFWFERFIPQPEGKEQVYPFFQRLMEGDPQKYEYHENHVVTRDGSTRLIAWHNSLLHDEDGSISGILSNGVDITERKAAEKKLQESEFLLRESQKVAGLGSYRLEISAGEWKSSEALERLFGIDNNFPRNLEGWAQLIHPDDRAMMVAYFEQDVVGRGQSFDKQYRIQRQDTGETRWVHGKGRLELDEKGHPVRMLGTIQDVTEQKRAEEDRSRLESQLRQAQKLESVGRLAGGVAHDFNNMLGVILGHSELALAQMEEGHPLLENLREIQKAAERSTELTRQLLAFARKQTVSPRVINLNETVEGMLKMLQRMIGESIELAWRPGPDDWHVKMDPSQIDQVLANLCVNARDAMDQAGVITIETRNVSFGPEECEKDPGVMPGEFVMLAVADNGCGMDAETKERIFEPFYSTKDQGEGTGLGLAMVHGIVAQNGGFIKLQSESGVGTQFRLYLPRHEGVQDDAAVPAGIVPDVKGIETILLVEDGQAILKLTTRILSDLGYRVVTANTPVEATRKAREHRGDIHLLITDVVMPEMNGRDLAKALLPLYPGLRRLFMSGYTADVIAHHGVLNEGIHFLQKPFSRKELARKVREVLDAD